MWKVRKEIHEGEMIPDLYGTAYRDYVRQVEYCYPIPLNIIVGIFYTLYMEIRKPWFRGNDRKRHDMLMRIEKEKRCQRERRTGRG